MIRLVVLCALVGCGAKVTYVAGTRIPYSEANDSVLKAVEEYRLAVERGDADGLMLMAAKDYWEDSGPPTGSDDYGYEGLRNVLLTRLQKASDIRYSMRYMHVSPSCKDLHPCCKASVEVLIEAPFTIQDVLGTPNRPDKRDQNERALAWDAHRWLFLSGRKARP